MQLKKIEETKTLYNNELSLYLIASSCKWKCKICPNAHYSRFETVDIPNTDILQKFKSDDNLKAIVIGGLEPMDQMNDLRGFIFDARKFFEPGDRPKIVIYTGYEMDELNKMHYSGLASELMQYGNAMVIAGRNIWKTKKKFYLSINTYLTSDIKLIYEYKKHQYS